MLGLLTEALQSDFGFRVVRPNGQAAPPVDDDTSGEHEPVDADELLAGARPGDVDERVLRSSASLMRKGLSVDEAVRTIIDELRVALADDPGRDWPDLEWRVRDKCLRFVQNNPELAAALPDELRTTFEGLLAAGRRPSIYWNKAAGRWLVRANKHDHDKKPDGAAKAEQPGAAAAPSSPSPTIEATPFRRFDPEQDPGARMALWRALSARHHHRDRRPRRRRQVVARSRRADGNVHGAQPARRAAARALPCLVSQRRGRPRRDLSAHRRRVPTLRHRAGRARRLALRHERPHHADQDRHGPDGPRRSSRRPRPRPSSKPSPPTRSASRASTPWSQRTAPPRTSPARWIW